MTTRDPKPDDRKLHGRSGGGDSGGGAYPNPHTGKEGKGEGWNGHGGQTDIDYYGHGRLGGKDVGGNANAPADGEDEG
jgi:hypothetical protein